MALVTWPVPVRLSRANASRSGFPGSHANVDGPLGRVSTESVTKIRMALRNADRATVASACGKTHTSWSGEKPSPHANARCAPFGLQRGREALVSITAGTSESPAQRATNRALGPADRNVYATRWRSGEYRGFTSPVAPLALRWKRPVPFVF